MNVQNRTLFIADNLEIMRGIDSETIDLIYLDPPFNTKKEYKAPIGSPAEGASFKDIWTDEDIEHEWHGEIAERNAELYDIIRASPVVYDASMKIYLTAMAVRLFEMQRILKPTGSIYIHCDPTASHYLKLVMDSLFGQNNFRNEIVWHYRRWTAGNKHFQRMHDIILRYTKSDNFNFNVQFEPYGDWIKKDYSHVNPDGKRWRWHTVKGKRYKVYLEDENKGVKLNDVWQIPYLGSTAKERTGYPTQKPLKLIERIIKASSNEGDILLDPFCGCATACVAAEQLGRHWIGIDISPSAEIITKMRLQDEVDDPPYKSNASGWFDPITDIVVSEDPPVRTDPPGPPRQLLLQDFFPRSLSAEYSQEQLQVFLSDKHRMYGNQEGKCNGCQYPLPFRNMTIDHIHPQSIIANPSHPDHHQIPQSIIANPDHPDNLQLLCGACNSTKGNRSQEDLIDKLREDGIIS